MRAEWWLPVIVVAAVLLAWLMRRAIRWARKGSKGGRMLAAAAFPLPDQPPPHEQVENANHARKGSATGDPE